MNTVEYIDTIWNGNPPGYIFTWDLSTKTTRFCENAGEVDEVVKAHESRDVWMGLATLPQNDTARPSHHRPTGNWKLAAIPGLHASIDFDTDHPSRTQEAEEEAQELARKMPVRPNMTLLTSRGLKVLWLFDRPWLLQGAEEQETARRMDQWWKNRLANLAGDTSMEIERPQGNLVALVRLPGTTTSAHPDTPAEVTRMYSRTRHSHHEYLQEGINRATETERAEIGERENREEREEVTTG